MGNEQPVPGGVVQHFGLGDVYWSPQTGAHYVSSGLIQRFYNEKGGPVSYLGFPVDNGWGKPRYGSDRELTMNQQQFEHGWVYYENRGQPHSVHGGVAAAYASQPGLGVPIGDETPIAGGVVQQFSNGRIYWSAATGGNTVRGGVWERYRDSGGPGGWLGLPTSGEIPTVGGVVQHFQHGEIYWKYPQGAFSVHGGVRARYALAGGPAGYLGFPTSSEEGPGQWVRQTFERGHIYWSWHTNAAYTVHGGVLTAYLGVGGIDSYLGLPTSSEIPTGGGVVQYFQRGWIGWTPAGSGVHVTG